MIDDILNAWAQLQDLDQQLSTEYARLGLAPNILKIPCTGPDVPVRVQDILFIESAGRCSRIYLRTGESAAVGSRKAGKAVNGYRPVLSNTGFSIGEAEQALSHWPQFQRLNDGFLVNLHHVQSVGSHPTRSRDFEVLLSGGHALPVPESRAPLLLRWFQTDSLRKVSPWHHQWGAAIYLDNLRPFDKELQYMSGEELRQHFTHPRTGRFQTRELMANFIWEYYHLMQRGLRYPVMGNIRTFWYILKPTLARALQSAAVASRNQRCPDSYGSQTRLRFRQDGKAVNGYRLPEEQLTPGGINSEKHYAQLLQVFQRMIVRYRLFRFADFDFTDEGERFYALGDKHPEIVLVSEKSGHFQRLQLLQREFGITIISLGGMPSVLTSEYFSQLLQSKIPASKPLKIISIVDYNPSGAIILKSFAAQLAHQGHKHLAAVHNLLTPEIFTPEELKTIVEPIPLKFKADQTKARRWLEAGGGINGQPLGLESEALVLNPDRFRQVFLTAFKQLTGKPRKLKVTVSQAYRPLEMTTTENLLVL
ncbi:MAG: LytTR family transcriptional regulator [Candidatus Sericytochromatia bacterium]|nr:LytTR family transcriptional regulator [Candidatus Sericytochromatia bacterium]